MNKTAYIYTLIDPRNDEIRYVGKTGRLKKRYWTHIRDAKRGYKYYVYNWIRQLLSLNLKPVMEILEECTDATWAEREVYWIAYGRQQGWCLTNVTDGGGGASGYKHTEEFKCKQSKVLKGRRQTEEHRRNSSEARKNPSDETRRKKSEAMKGNQNALGYKHTEEHNRKQSESMRGEKHPLVKLTESDVHEIRQMFRDGKKDREIAKVYGVTKQAINRIRHGKTWVWLE